MDVDVFILVAATLADPAHAVDADEREGFGEHSGRGIEVAKALDACRGEAGFLLELRDRGRFDRRVRILIADESRGELDAAAVQRSPRLVDEDYPALKFRKDHDRVDVVGAACIFPITATERANVLARPHHLRRRQIVKIHSSMSLSGISLMSPAER